MGNNKFKLVKVKGDPYQIGLQYGEACSKEIKGFLENLYGLIHSQFSLTMDQILKRIKPYHKFGYKYAPHLMEEIKGMGVGAGISFEEAFFLNARGELTYEQETEECTSYVVSKQLSSDNQLFMGQHVDMVPKNEDLGVILHIIPEKGPEILTWTIAGSIGQSGVNSKGLARCGNGLFSRGIKRGLPAQLVFRLLLEQESVDSALELFKKLERTKASNYLIGDASGKSVDIEAAADTFRVLEMRDGFLCHTNHFTHPDLLKFENIPDKPDDVRQNSIIRYQRIQELSKEKKQLSEEDVFNFLRDHKNAPNSICSHAQKGITPYQSVACVLAKPGAGKLYACKGTPCKNTYEEYRF